MRARCLIWIFLFLFLPLNAETTRLTPSEVHKIMDQLLEYHIDQKEVSTLILARSLKIYLKNFDSNHTYLLLDEAQDYIHPNNVFLEKVLKEYQKDRFNSYFTLNETIQKSIVRARGWRQEWEKDSIRLIVEAKHAKSRQIPSKTFAVSKTELKQRHYQQLLKFIAFQMEELGSEHYQGRENELVLLCERQISLMENTYLGMDEEGTALSKSEQDHQIILRTLKALAHSLDAHTAFYSPDEALAMKVQLEKGMCGIGVVLREGIDGIAIHEIIKGGPAERGGLQVGDTIVEVDGEKVNGYSFRRVLEIMRGKEGSQTVLGVMRAKTSNAPSFERVELVRSKITLNDKRVDVSSEPFGDGIIGKITLYSFYEGSDGISSEKDLRKAISDLKAQGPLYGLVLDLRENSGGFLSQAVRVSGLFITSGVVVISKYFDGSIKYYRAVDGERLYDQPLTVLISRGSASAAEIVAQTLQDYGVAIVVGDEQSYGKGTIQHQTITADKSNSFFKVTIGRYYTVSGKSTQIEGVKSDIVIPSDLNFEELGEGFLEFPLPADRVAAAFDDPLTDVDPFAKKWFLKYYTPTLQKKEFIWKDMVPLLKENSARRIEENKNFQQFLKTVKSDVKTTEDRSAGSNDLQMEESINILKDMIFLSHYPANKQTAMSPHF